MWDAPVMRWVVIPAIFFVVGPPAGALSLLVFPVVTSLLSPSLLVGTLVILPLFVAFSYVFGGVQALLTGFVAAAMVRRGGRVRAWPTILVAAVLGGLAAVASAVADDATERGGSLPNVATMLVIHLAGALAGLGMCRWIERRGRPGPA